MPAKLGLKWGIILFLILKNIFFDFAAGLLYRGHSPDYLKRRNIGIG